MATALAYTATLRWVYNQQGTLGESAGGSSLHWVGRQGTRLCTHPCCMHCCHHLASGSSCEQHPCWTNPDPSQPDVFARSGNLCNCNMLIQLARWVCVLCLPSCFSSMCMIQATTGVPEDCISGCLHHRHIQRECDRTEAGS